jgi:hypothetical protein
MTNTLAYSFAASLTKKKGLIRMTLEVNVLKLLIVITIEWPFLKIAKQQNTLAYSFAASLTKKKGLIDTKAKMIQIILFRIPTIAGQLSTDNFHYLLSSSSSSLSSKFRAQFCKTCADAIYK